jgi:hypothetical protein
MGMEEKNVVVKHVKKEVVVDSDKQIYRSVCMAKKL